MNLLLSWFSCFKCAWTFTEQHSMNNPDVKYFFIYFVYCWLNVIFHVACVWGWIEQPHQGCVVDMATTAPSMGPYKLNIHNHIYYKLSLSNIGPYKVNTHNHIYYKLSLSNMGPYKLNTHNHIYCKLYVVHWMMHTVNCSMYYTFISYSVTCVIM